MQLFQQIGNATRAAATLGFAVFATAAEAQSSSSPPGAAPPPTQATPQAPPQAVPQPAPPKPYQPVAVKQAQPIEDPTFEIFRKQLADVVKRKDRAALQKLVVTQGFFWESETGDKASKRKSGFENFATAIGLNDKDGTGWEVIAAAAAEPTLEKMEERKGVMCGPASPQIDDAAFEHLIKTTATDAEEWGFPNAKGIEVRATAQPNAPVVETLGMHLVRVMPDETGDASQPPTALRIVTPAGKVGYVPVTSLLPVVFDQLCYIKGADGWKIAGYSGGE
jgi:hypothetical protein